MFLPLQTPAYQPTFAEGLSLSSKKVSGWLTGFVGLLPNIFVALVVLLVLVAAGWALSYGVRSSLIRRRRHDLAAIFGGLIFWSMALFGTLIALTIILPSLNPGDLIASLGIGSIAIGFAFKDILQNWLAGVLILLRQPFRRGDQIKVGDHEGTVRRITSRAVYLKTYDGRRVIIPNAEVYSSSLLVHTAYKERRVTLDLTVGYDYDFRMIAGIIENEVSRIPRVLQEPKPQIMAWDLGSTSLGIRVRWWIEPQRSQEVATRAMLVQAIKEAFQANDIDPTDPQLVFYHEADANSPDEQDTAQKPRQLSDIRPARRAAPNDPPKAAPNLAAFAEHPRDPENEKPVRERTDADPEELAPSAT
ncbi:MAG: mechanosensitive ion channel family protein [Beijerinckiaceae bacterium]